MFVRRPRLERPIVLAAVVLPLLGVPTPALADDGGVSTGDTVVGELVQAWPEHADPAAATEHGDKGPLTWVATADGENIRVDTDDVDHLPVGATVEVTVGSEVRDQASREDGLEPSRDVLEADVLAPAETPATAPASAPYTDEVTVVLVQPPGTTPDTMTAQRLVDAVNGPVADFWESQSKGAIRLHGTAASATWVGTTAGCETPYTLWTEVAGDVAFVPGPGKHLLLYVPGYGRGEASSCSYGLAQVGSSRTGGGYLYVRAAATSVIAHELGHNFGLGHSSELQCDRTLDTGSCRIQPYYDLYDVMGASWEQVGSLNAPQAARLGVLPAAQQLDLNATSSGGTYTLSSISGDSGTRAVRLTGRQGGVYWLELRTATGRDAYLGDTTANYLGLQPGVLLRRSADTNDTSLLFDGTPSASSAWDDDLKQALPVGRSITVAGGDFTVSVLDVAPSSATLRILTASSPSPSAIVSAYFATGGAAGPLGEVTSGEWCGLRGGGCFRHFQNGSIYWTAATGVRVVTGSVRDRWASLGWESGVLGYPVTDTFCGLRDGGCFEHFQGGSLYRSNSGTFLVYGVIRDRWAASGWELGPLGYPTADTWCGLRGGGCFEHFQNGSIYWTAATGVRVVTGSVRDRWASLGWESGALGYPVTDTFCGLRDGGCFQDFQGGSLYRSNSGTFYVYGIIARRWGEVGWELGSLGYPTSEVACGLRDGGCFQNFQDGSIYYSPGTGAWQVTGAIRDAWVAQGWEAGTLGYPVDAPQNVAGGQVQRFQGGTLTYDATTATVTRN